MRLYTLIMKWEELITYLCSECCSMLPICEQDNQFRVFSG